MGGYASVTGPSAVSSAVMRELNPARQHDYLVVGRRTRRRPARRAAIVEMPRGLRSHNVLHGEAEVDFF